MISAGGSNHLTSVSATEVSPPTVYLTDPVTTLAFSRSVSLDCCRPISINHVGRQNQSPHTHAHSAIIRRHHPTPSPSQSSAVSRNPVGPVLMNERIPVQCYLTTYCSDLQVCPPACALIAAVIRSTATLSTRSFNRRRLSQRRSVSQ